MAVTRKLYRLSHQIFDGPFEVETIMSEKGVRATISLHALRTFDVMIPTQDWDVILLEEGAN